MGTLDRLGLRRAVQSLPHRKLVGHEICSYDGIMMRGRFISVGEHRSVRPYGLAVRRSLLDHALFRHACTFPAVTAIEELPRGRAAARRNEVRGLHGTGPDGKRSFTARLVAGCDGVNSVVARELGLSRLDKRLRKVALVGYWRGMETGNYGEVHLGHPGYFALAGVDSTTTNINFVVDGEVLKAANGDLDGFDDADVLRNPGWPAGRGTGARRPRCARRLYGPPQPRPRRPGRHPLRRRRRVRRSRHGRRDLHRPPVR